MNLMSMRLLSPPPPTFADLSPKAFAGLRPARAVSNFFYFCPRGPPGHVAASHTAFAVFAVWAVRPWLDVYVPTQIHLTIVTFCYACVQYLCFFLFSAPLGRREYLRIIVYFRV